MATTSAKPFSISFGTHKSKQPPPAPSNPRKRPRSTLEDQDSDNEEKPRAQAVTGFDQAAGGAISTSITSDKSPLIIQPQKNRDWREETRQKRVKNLLPAEVQAAQQRVSTAQGNGGVDNALRMEIL